MALLVKCNPDLEKHGYGGCITGEIELTYSAILGYLGRARIQLEFSHGNPELRARLDTVADQLFSHAFSYREVV